MAEQAKSQVTYSSIVNPEGKTKPKANPIAKRIDSLEGIHLGVLDDNLPHADQFLDEVITLLKEKHNFSSVKKYTKDDLSLPAADWKKEELHSECDAVLVGVGDCGSCTSQCIFDAVDIEKRGTPSAPFVTSEFTEIGQYEARSFGMGGLPIIELQYPLAYNVTEKEARQRAHPLIDEVVGVLTNPKEQLEDEYDSKYLATDENPPNRDFVCEF